MNSNELLCEAGLEHDFNCLIVKCIFGKGRCQTRLVEDAAFFGSDDFSYFKWQKSLCVVCASCVLYIDMMDEPANSRHNDSRTNEEIQVLADPHNRRDDGRLCALLFCPQEFQYRHAEHRGYIRHNQGPTGAVSDLERYYLRSVPLY